MSLRPNSPAKRLAYVLKTYKDQPWVVAETASIVAATIGVDRFSQWIDYEGRTSDLVEEAVSFIKTSIPEQYLATTRRVGEGWVVDDDLSHQQIIEHLFDLAIPPDSRESGYALTMAEPWNKEAARYLVELLSSTPKGQADHAADGIIPWIAQQVSKLFKARAQETNRSQGRITNEDMVMLIDELHKKSNAIAAWAKANRKDIGKVSLAEALEGAKDFEVVKTVEQGQVVYRYSNGYTMQMLRTKSQLEEEGEVMQHCVGGYWNEVHEGSTVIFSLRDEKGRPHVTIEWVPDWDQILYDQDDPSTRGPGKLPKHKKHPSHFEISPEEFMESPVLRRGNFIQIYGKQNEPPAEKYQGYVQEFIREKFDGEPQGMLMAGAHPKDIRFSDRVYMNVQLDGLDLDLSRTDWSRSKFSKVNFTGNDFTGAKFIECEFLLGNRFDGADFKYAQFDRSGANGSETNWAIMFDGARLNGATFIGVDFSNVSFEAAHMVNALLESGNFENCDFQGADLTSASFNDSVLEDPIFTSGESRNRFLAVPTLEGASFKNTKGVPDWVIDASKGIGQVKHGEYHPEADESIHEEDY